jgi:N utilization substance protein A
LAARLTGYKIDIKSETQAIESGELPANWMELAESYEEEYYDEYAGEYADEYVEDYE